jgi:phage shock protein E
MTAAEVQNYLIPAAIVLFFVWRFLKFKKTKALLPELLKQGGIIVDVRSADEFSQGRSPLSINIPLNEISRRAQELDKTRPIILCCASGARSGAALGIFKSLGFTTVVNAGPWTNTVK